MTSGYDENKNRLPVSPEVTTSTTNGTLYEFEGYITSKMVYGRPNFGEDPLHDEKRTAYILKLQSSISFKDDFYDGTTSVLEINGNYKNSCWNMVKKVANKNIKIKIKASIYGADHGGWASDLIVGEIKTCEI
jgi:hypothetical protein